MAKKKFFILDGSSLLYRAFYALPLLESETGIYTNAIVGFSNMLVKLLTDWHPDYLVIAFDKGKHTFRTEMFAEYKGTRKPMPQELRSQVPMLHEMAEAWNVPFIELAGFEADDIIGTLANKAVDNGFEAYVVTGDRDALQLVKPDLTVLFTKKGISDIVAYDEAVFQSEYEGLDPIQLIDLKGLMGDTSDNIPGVPKVGPKTAIKLIAAYGSVEQVLLHIEEVSGKALKERLRDNQEQALMSKQLATIKLDVPVDFSEEDFALTLNGKALENFYNKYNIRSVQRNIKKLVSSMGNADVVEVSSDAEELNTTIQIPEAQIVTDVKLAKNMVKQIVKQGKVYAVPVFEGKVPHKKLQMLGVAIPAGESSEVYCLPAEIAADAVDNTGMGDLFAEVSPAAASRKNPALIEIFDLLSNDKVTKYLHDLKGFYHAGIDLAGNIFDLELVGYLLNPSVSKYTVPDLAYRYGQGFDEVDKEWPVEKMLGWEAFAIGSIAAKMMAKLESLGMIKLYEEIEMPLVKVLSDMEQTGIMVNRDKLQSQSVQVGARIKALEEEIYALAGRKFNIASPKQLGEVLFDDLKLPVIKKTKTGYSTNVEVLNELYSLHPVIEKILDYRLWTKLKSTYLDGIAPLIDEDTKRVHTSFNQTVTATGRLSSSEPNLQNIPVRRDEGKHIRELFEPGPGYDMLVSADYSQIELRVLADMSQDENFLNAFRHQEDVHARTAAEVFGVPMEDVDADLRRKAKAVNFGIVYGISDYGLSQDLHITRAEAKEYIEKYFVKCQGVKAFIDSVVGDAKQNGYVLTKYGRRRDLPAIRSSNFNQRSLAERMAMNTPIQGTAADIIKIAMIRAHKGLQDAGLKSRVLLQVHDELVLEVVADELSQVKEILQDAMSQAVELSVPLTIDINTGKNWAEAK